MMSRNGGSLTLAAVVFCVSLWLSVPANAWQRVTNGLPASPTITRIANSSTLATLNVSSGSPIGVYYSTNGGLNWVKTSGALPGSGQSANELLVVGNTIYAARNSQSVGTNAILFSTNFGASWIGGTGIPNSTSITLLAHDGSALFAGAAANGNVWRSTDGGVSWQLVGSAAGNFNNGTARAIGAANGRALVAASTGFYLLSDSGTNWSRISSADNNTIIGTRMAWQSGRLFALYGTIGRRSLALLDGTTNLFNATNGLLEGTLNLGDYRDIATDGATGVFAATRLLNPSFAYDARLFHTVNGGTNWNEITRVAGSSDVATISVISNGLFAAMTATPSGLYRVMLVDGVPLFPPQFTANPLDLVVKLGSNATFTAGVSSSVPMSAQWRKNGADIVGETNLSLTLLNVTTNDSASYTLAAWNAGGTNISSAGTLTVIPPLPGWPDLDFQPGIFATETSGLKFGGTVYCLAALTNGQILVGGQFTHVNAEPTPNPGFYTNGVLSQGIARLNPDGSADIGFQTSPGISIGGSVRAIAVAQNGKIFIAGNFTNYNGVASTNLARLNSDGSLDTDFSTPQIFSANNFAGDTQKLLPLPDGRVIVMGTFTNINGVGRTNIVCLNPDGSLDTVWPASGGVTFNNSVFDVDFNAAGEVMVAGSFTSFNGLPYRRLVATGTNGILNTNFFQTFNNNVSEVELQPGGLTWVNGPFTQYTNGAAVIASKPVRVSGNGMVVSASPTNLTTAQLMQSQEDGAMITSFYNASAARYQLMRFAALGNIDDTFTTATGFDSSLAGMAMSPSGDLYVAGFFTSVSGVPAQGLAKIRATSTNVPPTLPVFTLLPQSSDYASNATVTLRTAAAGMSPLQFFWFKDGTPVAAGTNMLVLSNFNATLAGAYQIIASNSFGSVTGAVANLTFASPPSITQQPPAFAGSTNGGTVFLSLTATGTQPLAYRWYRNGGTVNGATNSSHTITNLSASLAGNWTAIVSNLYGRTTSSISVVATGAPPGIFSQPANQTINGTGDVSLSVIASPASTFPLNFFWYKSNILVHTWTTNGFLNSVYSISNALPPDAGQYYVVISNFVGTITSLVRTVTINNPHLAVAPVNTSVVLGGTTNFNALATGTAPIDYYWYRRTISPVTTNFVGNGTTLPIIGATRADGQGTYFVVASNTWGKVTSGLRNLVVQYAPAITNYYPGTSVESELNSFVTISLQYEGEPSPTARWFKDGEFQPSLFGGFVSFPSVQSSNAGTYQLVLSNYLGSVTSAPIVLTVKPARGPTITNDPVNRTVKVGDFLNLNVAADGTPTMYYAWFKQDGTPVTAYSSSPFYTPTISSTNQTGGYYCIVTNAYGSDTSTVAQVTVVVAQPAAYGNKQFVKIADSLTIIPGLGTNRFGGFRDAFLRNRQVWFGGTVSGVSFSAGVYHWSNNVISSLVNTNAAVPGSANRFTNFFGSTYLSANKVIFGAYGTGDKHGLYAWTNGNIITIHDTSTLIPGLGLPFERFGWPTVAGDKVAFLGFCDPSPTTGWDYRGVFVSSNGVIAKLADTNTVLPNLGGRFVASSSQVGFDGTTVAWWAINETTNGGIFSVGESIPIASGADEATINPATGQFFDGFISPPNVRTGRVYLVGHDTSFNTSLFYRDPAGPLTVIAKPGDAVPSRGMPFDSVGYPYQISSAAGNFFDGTDGGSYSGVFFWNGTNTVKVIDSLDTLDGSPIQYVYVADADDDCVLLYVGFTNGRQALYATLPAAGAQTFNQWASAYTFPPGQSDPEDNPDGDPLVNAFEYYFGSNPTAASAGNLPTGLTVNVSGTVYPAITFVRSQSATGATLLPQASSTVTFADSLGLTVSSVVDLGGGLERVTIRSTVSAASQSSQFLRIQLTIP